MFFGIQSTRTMRNILTFGLSLLFFLPATAQAPRNDECINAIRLPSVEGYCSQVGEFTTVAATVSSVANPSCFVTTATSGDVWFSFEAIATQINISIVGQLPVNAGGTLRNPQFALYAGACNTLRQLGCLSDLGNRNTIQAFNGPLSVGEIYYIRVSSRTGQNGTFQLCVNNFNQQASPSGDCATANILCDKKSITAPLVNGRGQDPREIRGACTGPNCGLSEEDQSSWYKWTCQQAGTLTFSINPLNPDDDIDFVLYELPNGINDCSNKRNIRCMFAGEIVGAPINQWRPCTGPTGLREGERDDIEFCGCGGGNNNFVNAVNMVAGRSYALVINNFSQSGAGFTINFGGTGTFVGPKADFTTDQSQACVGKPVTFTDASSFSGGIASWSWTFGTTANRGNATTQGAHQIEFNRPGQKRINLSVTSRDGCTVTESKTINVRCCSDHFSLNPRVTDETCPDASDGQATVSASNRFGPYRYRWSNQDSTTALSNLRRGTYQLTITDQATCDTVVQLNVGGPPPFSLRADLGLATCNGGRDGFIRVQARGGTPPYTFAWNNAPAGRDSNLLNVPIGPYTLRLTDAQNCVTDTTFTVRELALRLAPNIDSITRPRCFGNDDGAIRVTLANGLGPYQFDFNDGRGFQAGNALNRIRAGTYRVSVRDANLCRGEFNFNVQDFPRLGVDLALTDPSCFNTIDGRITLQGRGGAGNYSYRWATGETLPQRTALASGAYAFTVTDRNGCTLDTQAVLNNPPPLFLETPEIVNVACFGDTTGRITLRGRGGTPPLQFSINGRPFRSNNLFVGLAAGTYRLTIQDAAGCSTSRDTILTEPPQLRVDAGFDQTINLGESVQLRAIPNTIQPVRYAWSPPELLNVSTIQNPVASPVNTTDFRVTITETTAAGCTATDLVRVIVVKNRPIYAPNAFSPGVDNINSGFILYGTNSARRIKMLRIFDRWGELVFEKGDLGLGDEANGWDGTFGGKPMNAGVFVYVAEIEFIDAEVVTLKGEFTLVR